MELFHCAGDRDDLLNDLAADERRDEAAARPGEQDGVAPGREPAFALEPPQEVEHLFRLTRVVALITLTNDALVLDQHRLDGGRAYVDGGDPHARAPRLRTR